MSLVGRRRSMVERTVPPMYRMADPEPEPVTVPAPQPAEQPVKKKGWPKGKKRGPRKPR